MIFVKSQDRAEALSRILNMGQFPSSYIHGRMNQAERIRRFDEFKKYGKRIIVSTDLLGRGIDINKVNVVINYDLPELEINVENKENVSDAAYDRAIEQYIHR